MVRIRSISTRRWLVPAAMLAGLAISSLATQAQTAPQAARPDPLDSKASVPALTYESSFSQYRKLGEEKPVSWRDANDTVTRLGGWRVYAREAPQPDPPPPAKPASGAATMPKEMSKDTPKDMAKPMPPGHAGHKTP